MVVSVFLYPVLYGLELFLASALITQIAVSLAAVVVSTVTIYFCKQQLVSWHQERLIKKRLRWQSDVSIKSSRRKKFGERSESSEGEMSDSSFIRRQRAGLRRRSHDPLKSRGNRESAAEKCLRSSQRTAEESKKDLSETGKVRPKLTRQVGAMHRSHWVAKPQDSLSTSWRRSSEGDADLRGGGSSEGVESLTHSEVTSSISTELMLEQSSGKAAKRSRAVARMTFKEHPRFSSDESSSSTPSPVSSSAESDDLMHGASVDKAVINSDVTGSTRRVPSIQVEPIVEERIIPLGRRNSHPQSTPSEQEESTGTEISTLEFSFVAFEPEAKQTNQCNTSQPSADLPKAEATDTNATATKRDNVNKDDTDLLEVPVFSTTDISVENKLAEENQSNSKVSNPKQTRKDSLGVPSVITGAEAYTESTSTTSDSHQSVWVSEIAVEAPFIPLISTFNENPDRLSQVRGGEDCSDVRYPFTGFETAGVACHNLSSEIEVKTNKGMRMDSLDVPPTLMGEVCFPPLMLTGGKDQTSHETPSYGEGAPSRKIIKIRPKSLDIPPMMPASPQPTNAEDTTPSPLSGVAHGVKRKHGGAKSILKRSGSIERPGRKKSVSFSPDVSPREFAVDECFQGDADCEQGDSPKRPRVFRHFSMDIPDAKIATAEEIARMSAATQPPWSHGNSDDIECQEALLAYEDDGELMRAEGWVHPSPLEPMQVEGSNARMAFVSIHALESDDSDRKSAKERFLEAGGAKAVLSVLCTQDSIDANGVKYPSSPTSVVCSGESPKEDSDEDSLETMPDIYQPTSASDDLADQSDIGSLSPEVNSQETDIADTHRADCSKGIKSRFLEYKEDSADIHTSRLFVETVRSSVESDSSDEQDRSSGRKQEAKDESKEKTVASEEEKDDLATSAKSRFLQSCQDYGDNQTQNGSSFVVSVVRPCTDGHRRQNAATNEMKDSQSKQSCNRDVLDGSNDDVTRSPGSSKSETDISNAGIHSGHGRASASPQHSPSDNTAVVIDNGSSLLRVGFAGDVKPRFTVPTVVGRNSAYPSGDSIHSSRTSYIGYEATDQSGILSLEYPSSGGVVHSWEDMEQVWEYVFTSLLEVCPRDQPVLLSEYASATKQERETCAEIFFEKLSVPSLCLINQGALALHGQGDTSGMVLSSGAGLTEVIPVLDGCTIRNAVTTLKVAGSQITHNLSKLLQAERGYSMASSAQVETLRQIKEKLAYVCMDFNQEGERVVNMSPLKYELPDGASLTIGHKELYHCTEQLFRPALVGLETQPGIHDMIQETLKRCDPTVLAGMRKSLLLAGGNTQLRGFGDRLQLELASAHLPWSVSMPQERSHSVWTGGSVMAAHGDFARRCVTAAEYAEHGASVVQRKCF